MIGVIAARTPLLVAYFRRLMGREGKIKKYPILRYLSYLVIVSILLTGVSLARYTGASSGNVGATLSNFVCSYEISDASSLIFSFHFRASPAERSQRRSLTAVYHIFYKKSIYSFFFFLFV